MSEHRADVIDVIDGKEFAVGHVSLAKGWNREEPSKRDLEEMGLFGSSAVEEVTRQVMHFRQQDRAPALLWACRLISQALRNQGIRGKRDEDLERDIGGLALRHSGNPLAFLDSL